VFLTYKYRLFTRRTHRRALEKALEESRLLYNDALQERISAWKVERKRITSFDQYNSATLAKQDVAVSWNKYSACMGRWPIKRVDDAFNGFFGRWKAGKDKAGFPRFRSMSRWDSFGFTEWSGIKLKGNRLRIKGVAQNIRVNLHRPLPTDAEFCSTVITRQNDVWYVCIQVEIPTPDKLERTHENTGGGDWGVENSMTMDDGRVFASVRPGKDRAPALRRAQRAVARCKRGGKNRKKRVLELGRLKHSEKNGRTLRLHEISKQIVSTTPYVGVEALQVKNMTASATGTAEAPGKNVRQKAALNRSILEGAPSRLISFIRYKAEWAGGEMRAGNARRSSIECAACGRMVPKALSERLHRCDCGFGGHRDFNASCNIRYRTFGTVSPAVLEFRQRPNSNEAVVGLMELNVAGISVRAPRNITLESIISN
jgi:putative transposase